MTESKYSETIKSYLLKRLTIGISPESNNIDKAIKELNRMREHKKVEQRLKTIDYMINQFFIKN